MVDCNQHSCSENCQYRDNEPKTINEDCPGVVNGINEHMIDTLKNEWYIL